MTTTLPDHATTPDRATLGGDHQSRREQVALAVFIAVPFLAVALGVGQAMSAARFLRDQYMTVRIVSGLILVAAGLLVFFDKTYVVNAWVARISG